jgi:hypothetical protein
VEATFGLRSARNVLRSIVRTFKQRMRKPSVAPGDEKFRRLPAFKTTFLKICHILIQMGQRAGRPGKWGSITYKSKRFLSSSQRPDRLWVQFSLYPFGYKERFPGG